MAPRLNRLIDEAETDPSLRLALRSAKEGGASAADAERLALLLGVAGSAAAISGVTNTAQASVSGAAHAKSIAGAALSKTATHAGLSVGAKLSIVLFSAGVVTAGAGVATRRHEWFARASESHIAAPATSHAAPEVVPRPTPHGIVGAVELMPTVAPELGVSAEAQAENVPEKKVVSPVVDNLKAHALHRSAAPQTPAPEVPQEAPTEFALLNQAQLSLQSNPSEALRILDRHAQYYATGTLSEEREVLRVQTLLALHRHDEAARVGEAFLSAHPTSSYARRIRQLIQK